MDTNQPIDTVVDETYIDNLNQAIIDLTIANKQLAFHKEEAKKNAAKLTTASRLYAFISQINQTISHVTDQQTLFDEACQIAINIGKFKLAWISLLNELTRKITIVAHVNAPGIDNEKLNTLIYDNDGPTLQVIKSGKLQVINNFETLPCNSSAKKYAVFAGFRSAIVLPLKKNGTTIGIFTLFSDQVDLFDEQEIRLLKEAAGDISFALDVFEKEKHRKQMEDKLAHSEFRLKQAQAIAHIGNWEMNFSTGNGEWSEEACRIYGVSPEDNVQSYQSWVSFVHPDDLDNVLRIIKENEKTLSSSAFRHRIILKNGAVKHIFSEAHFEFSKEGVPIGLYGIAHDITETKEAEIALAQSEANLTQIMDLIPQSIFIKDYNGKYIFTNKTYASLYGYTPEQINNKSMSDIIPGKGMAEYYLLEDRQVISSGNNKVIPEFAMNDHKGNARLLHILKVPFTIADTNKRSVLVVMNDITQQKKAEKERTKIIADIVQRNNDLEQFSYIVSHNLRAPVANILGLVNIMQTIGLEKDEVESTTEFLKTAAQNLDHVIIDINHILEIKNDVSAKRETINFHQLLNEIRSGISNRITDEQAIINTNFLAAPEIITVNSYLYSIFYNLISNSLKYHRPGIIPVIDITSLKTNSGIRIIFNDNCLGIDLEKNGADIFGLYKRFHYHVEGKGMGLFMIKTQVESLGGKITLTSEVNKGTQFIIEFEISEINS